MNNRNILILSVSAIVLAVISVWIGQQAYTWLPPQASSESLLIDNLFSFLVTLGAFIFLGVTGAILYSVLFYRAGKYDISDGPPIEGNITLEVVWTAIPLVLVIWIATYSYNIYDQMSIRGPMQHLHMGMASAHAESTGVTAQTSPKIEVNAKQWAWVFRYPEQNITSTELHLPVNERAYLTLKSEDVIHGFYIPAFRIKQDIIPPEAMNFEFTPIREGKYRLRDSEFSGTYFAAMQADVVVESAAKYQEWLQMSANQIPSPAPNQAASEYGQKSERAIKTSWATVVPAAPPVVNFHS